MARNLILDELHAARQKLLADCNGNTTAYLREAQQRLEASGRPIWQGKQRLKHSSEPADQSLADDGSTAATR